MNENKGKVAFLFAPGPFGGAENIVLQGAKALDAQIWLIKETRNPAPWLAFKNLCEKEKAITRTFECRSRFDLEILEKLRREIKRTNTAIVHSHGIKANFYCGFLPARRVGTQHGKTSIDPKVRFYEFIEAMILRKLDALVFVSAKDMESNQRPNCHLVENFLVPRGEKQNYSEKGALELLFVGRLSKEKGLEDLFKALSLLKFSVGLTIAGVGPELERLKALAPSSACVRFEGFKEDLAPYYEKADALILPSRREGLPLCALEAAAAGLPLLTSKVGGLPDLVKENGVLFSPHNPRDMARAIEKFERNRKAHNRFAQIRSKEILEKHSPENWAKQTQTVYDMIL